MSRRLPSVPHALIPACALFVGAGLFAGVAGCGDGSPYRDEGADASEGTAPPEDGAVNRALDPGDAGTVGEPDDERVLQDSPAAAETDAATAAGPGALRVVNHDQFRGVLAGLKGKTVLVDCWATWCGPCRENFPHTVALAETHAADGLAVVTLAFDDPDDRGKVEEFLESQNAGGLTNLMTEKPEDQSFGALGEQLPTYAVFAPDGTETARVVGGGESQLAEIDAAIAAALQK